MAVSVLSCSNMVTVIVNSNTHVGSCGVKGHLGVSLAVPVDGIDNFDVPIRICSGHRSLTAICFAHIKPDNTCGTMTKDENNRRERGKSGGHFAEFTSYAALIISHFHIIGCPSGSTVVCLILLGSPNLEVESDLTWSL